MVHFDLSLSLSHTHRVSHKFIYTGKMCNKFYLIVVSDIPSVFSVQYNCCYSTVSGFRPRYDFNSLLFIQTDF